MKSTFTIILISIYLFYSCGNNHNNTASDSENSDDIETLEEDLKWSYSEDINEMTSIKVITAMIPSSKSYDFEFPYEGGSRLVLTIKKASEEQKYAILSINNGRFTSDYINVRFDNNQAIRYSISELNSNNLDNRLIDDADDFESKLKVSDSIKIQCDFNGNKTRIFPFKVKGYKL